MFSPDYIPAGCTFNQVLDVLIVCPGLHSKEISNYLESDEANTTLNIKLDAYDMEDPTTGTMEVLSKVASRCQVSRTYRVI